jgi:hypothetical protein
MRTTGSTTRTRAIAKAARWRRWRGNWIDGSFAKIGAATAFSSEVETVRVKKTRQ